MTKKPTGYIIYEGNSLLDDMPIVEIAILKSGNSKTGNMVQTYIMRSDIDPRLANKTGQDYSICGSCVHRGKPTDDPDRKLAKDRSCYVNISQGVLIVWKAYKAGKYPYAIGHEAISSIGKDRMVRIGTYGDGGAVPSYVNQSLVSLASGSTGYCHQSGNAKSSFDPSLYMVSADTKSDAMQAWQAGYRTFRVMSDINDMDKKNEILCPASEEAGRRTTCHKCKLCSGNAIAAKSIAIVAHGAGRNNFA